MKKTILSALVVGSFSIYAFFGMGNKQNLTKENQNKDLNTDISNQNNQTASIDNSSDKTSGVTSSPKETINSGTNSSTGQNNNQNNNQANNTGSNTNIIPTSTPKPVTNKEYKDGTFTGSQEDAYYGTVQVQATFKSDKLVDVKFLSYPNDKSTSRQKNAMAMPILISEAISAQSANVDAVTGASLTSGAFRQSLQTAIDTAKI